MSEQLLPFFGEDWCRLAREAANAAPDLQAGFADAAAFSLVLAFECTDHPDIASWAEFHGGQVHQWRSGPATADGYTVTLRAAVDTWRSAADGTAYASALLIGRKIKIRDPKTRIAANYNAFEALLASWADIPTAWP